MKTIDTNRVNMIRTTCAFCDDNAAVTAAITNYATTVTAVKNKLVLIDNLNIVSSGTSKGVTLDTRAIRNSMQTLTEKLCNALQAYGAATSNNTIVEGSKYSFSSLSRFPKETVDDVSEGVYNLANTNAAALVPYGIGATDISDTITAINLFRTATDNPRQSIIQKKVANEQIVFIVRDVIDNYLKKQLDKMTNIIKTTNPVYFSGYNSAREILNLGSSGSVKLDEELAFPIPAGISEIDLSGVTMSDIDEIEIRNTADGSISAGFGATSSSFVSPVTVTTGATIKKSPAELGFGGTATHFFLINLGGASTFRVIMRG